MHLLITGGAGFIGSNLIRLALRRGHEVLNIDKLTYAGNPASLGDLEAAPNYRFLQADICDAEAMRAAFASFRPGAVMHLAAESHVDRSIDGPMEFVQTNVVGTVTLLQAATDYWRKMQRSEAGDQKTEISPRSPQESFRFLHVSTDEVYGSLGDSGLFTESSPYDPHSPYSASKASSDHFVRSWHDTFGLPTLITNCSNNYGPYQFPEKLIPVVILKALRGEPIPVYGKGENIRDWLYVEDHAEALLTVLEKGTIGQTYNIGGNNEMRNIDLVRLLCRILDEELEKRRPEAGVPEGAKAPILKESSAENPKPRKSENLISFVTDRPGHDLRYAIDATKIRSELGWAPKQDHESGFRKTVEWYLDNECWWQEILDGSYQLQRLGKA